MQCGFDRLPNHALKWIRASKREGLIVEAGSALDDSPASQQCFQATRVNFYSLHHRTDPLFFQIAISLNAMSHIMKQMLVLKTVKGIPMDSTRAMVDQRAFDA
jgi:hypothetical protein